jgi:hypothetical protein
MPFILGVLIAIGLSATLVSVTLGNTFGDHPERVTVAWCDVWGEGSAGGSRLKHSGGLPGFVGETSMLSSPRLNRRAGCIGLAMAVADRKGSGRNPQNAKA